MGLGRAPVRGRPAGPASRAPAAQRRGRALDRVHAGDAAPRAELVDTTNEVFADLLDYYEAAQRTETTLAGAAIHDALAVVRISHPHLLAGLPRPVEMALSAGPTRGMTVVDQRPSREPDPPNALVIDWADADAVRHLIRDALVGQGERSPTGTAYPATW